MPFRYPLMAVRNTVVFPNGVLPVTVARPRSLAAIEKVLASDEESLVVLSQKDPTVEEPGGEDLYRVGTRVVLSRVRHGEGRKEMVLQGLERVRVLQVLEEDGHLVAEVESWPIPKDGEDRTAVEALQREIIDLAAQALELLGQARGAVAHLASQLSDPLQLAYFLVPAMGLGVEKAQAVLEAETRKEALEKVLGYLRFEIEVLGIQRQLSDQTRQELNQEQREHLLRRQLKSIQKELGEDDESSEVEELRKKLDELELDPEVRKELERELKRLQRTSSGSADYQVIRTYLELVLDLPWNETTEDQLDLARARQILDRDHHGLQEIKERILEQLAVLKLNPEAKSPILLFVGPPGVGKTSLGQSIAKALGREFERSSLGGLHDESELRGHRRTYIGAMPGRLITALRRAGTKNPVLMLDEIDKLGRGFRGDPAAALLEIIDPAQNDSFRDNYVDLPFDLSQVFFIMTANSLDTLPRPLLDRMEVIHLTGYSQEEKLHIARQYLVPRRLEQAGLPEEKVAFLKEALQLIIARYTREAGVRGLERQLGKLARKIALRYAEGDEKPITVNPDLVVELLGPEKFQEDRNRRQDEVGVANGLAWTPVGGDLLNVEALLVPEGKGVTLTGQLGEVMRESAQTAQSYVRARAQELRIPGRLVREAALHVHVPAGAIPKDGPSAGVTMVSAVASAYTGIPLRHDVAMTGEVTLTGQVLPVGGIKEKVLAARRHGITEVILPQANARDLNDLPEHVRAELTVHLVERVEQVLEVVAPELARRLAEEERELLTSGFLN